MIRNKTLSCTCSLSLKQEKKTREEKKNFSFILFDQHTCTRSTYFEFINHLILNVTKKDEVI